MCCARSGVVIFVHPRRARASERAPVTSTYEKLAGAGKEATYGVAGKPQVFLKGLESYCTRTNVRCKEKAVQAGLPSHPWFSPTPAVHAQLALLSAPSTAGWLATCMAGWLAGRQDSLAGKNFQGPSSHFFLDLSSLLASDRAA